MSPAAEYALSLLDGQELRDAISLESSDPEFAREVARWRGRLAPLANEVEAVEPPASLWARIDHAVATGADDNIASNDNVVALRRRVSSWRAATVGMTALAASLGLVLLQQPHNLPPVVSQQPSANPMVAMLGNDQKQTKVMASWDPASRQLVLAVAGDIPGDPNHSHELWVIPSGGKPCSLGTLQSAKQMHMQLAAALAQLLQQGATIAISVEPRGGSPTGAPTGPVVASGSLDKA